MPRRSIPMAIVYDFDGTLAPGNVQERQFIPEIGMNPQDFWAEVNRIARDQQADSVLIYMYLMLKKAKESSIAVRLEDFKPRGKDIEFFEGVTDWFDRINEYGKQRGVAVKHYIISSGNAEIIEGCSIESNFERIYASRFLFDENGVAVWPSQAVNYTTKTQYLFRINKGAYDLSSDREINQFIEPKQRPMPFENLVYIGDGSTDVPCFRLVKEQGGRAIAVFPPNTKGAKEKAEQFRTDGRVHHVVPAKYGESSDLDQVVKSYVRLLAERNTLSKF